MVYHPNKLGYASVTNNLKISGALCSKDLFITPATYQWWVD